MVQRKSNGSRSTSDSANGKSTSEAGSPIQELYFLSLTVRSIRCFGPEPQTLNLHKAGNAKEWAPWTIILGNNGTGKSTLLELLASMIVSKISEDDGVKSFLDFYHHPSSKPWLTNDQRTQEQNRKEETKIIGLWKTDEYHVKYDFDCGNLKFFFSSGFGLYFQRNLGFLQDGYRPILGAYGAWRRLGRSTLTPEKERQGWLHIFDDSIDLVDAEEWILRAKFNADGSDANVKARLQREFDLIQEMLLKLIAPGVTGVRVSNASSERPQRYLLFTTPYGEVRLPHLGFGYQSLITWVVDFAVGLFQAYPCSKNPLAEPAICIVDEIDLHLHPSWQRNIMAHLSRIFPKTQFIATAHSPLIVQSAAEVDANVVVLTHDPAKGHVVIHNNDPSVVFGWRVDQILSSDLFDVPMRSPLIQKKIDERDKLLAKSKLTTKDEARLAELDAEIGELPIGSTPQDRELAHRLRSAVELLEKNAAAANDCN